MLPGFFNSLSLSAGKSTSALFNASLYTAVAGETVTVTTGMDMLQHGGMVLARDRMAPTRGSVVFDNKTGLGFEFGIDVGELAYTVSPAHQFTASGFKLSSGFTEINDVTNNSCLAWSWRMEPSFFNIIKYTGNGSTGRKIPHGLTTDPGMVLIHKNTGVAQEPIVWHAGLSAGSYIFLSMSAAQSTNLATTVFGNTFSYISPDATNVTLGSRNAVNYSGSSYTMYVWSNDNIRQKHASMTTNSSGAATVNLGFRPQALIIKRRSAVGPWMQIDSLRGTNKAFHLDANGSEVVPSESITFTNTGFTVSGSSASIPYIYSAWRDE